MLSSLARCRTGPVHKNISVCKMGLTGVHDSYGSWHLYIYRFLFGLSTFLSLHSSSTFWRIHIDRAFTGGPFHYSTKYYWYSMRRMKQYFPVGWTNPSGSKFRVKTRNRTKGVFLFLKKFCVLALGFSTILKLK